MPGRRAVAAVVVALTLTGRGDADPGEEADGSRPDALVGETSTPGEPDSPATGRSAQPTPTDEPSASVSVPAEPCAEPPEQSEVGTALPGEPYDHRHVDEGDVLGVVGVEHDDVLDVRAGPTVDAAIVTTAAPTEHGLVSTGRTRVVDDRFRHEVTVRDVTGWVSWRYVSFIGPSRTGRRGSSISTDDRAGRRWRRSGGSWRRTTGRPTRSSPGSS